MKNLFNLVGHVINGTLVLIWQSMCERLQRKDRPIVSRDIEDLSEQQTVHSSIMCS